MSTPVISSVLFVCMGNICRSPMAEGIARQVLYKNGWRVRLDSAGTHDYHPGALPDPRARQVATSLGWAIDDLRARQVRAEDFLCFDLILAADKSNLQLLKRIKPEQCRAEIALLLPWCGITSPQELPDPYYGDLDSFQQTAELLQLAMTGFLDRLKSRA